MGSGGWEDLSGRDAEASRPFAFEEPRAGRGGNGAEKGLISQGGIEVENKIRKFLRGFCSPLFSRPVRLGAFQEGGERSGWEKREKIR